MDIFRFRDHVARDCAEYGRTLIHTDTPDVRADLKRAIDDDESVP